MIRHDRTLVRVGLALGLLALTAASPSAASQDDSYGYFRVIEGSATLMQAGSGNRTPAEVNQPVLAGDRVWVSNSSRVEIVLADRNILRLDGGSELTLEQLAASPDRDDPATVLRLHDGNVLLNVVSESLGDQLPRVDTPNASVYPQAYGTYRITASQGSLTEVTVRRGKAEVVTDRGSEVVRADESAFVEGDRYASVEVESASSYDALERWADRLNDEARYASNDYLDESLRYQAAPLARYGNWVYVEGRRYWSPRVDAGWRPYWHGRWAYTPAGLNWISYEPWGWVPYHYGSWDYVSGHGWLWQPGYTWAPAWVYWYWGPSYVGWCPTGYYTSYYRHSYPYFRSGVYGWAGGGWGGFSHWTFVGSDYFRGYRNGYRNGYWDGRRDDWDVRRHAVPVDELSRRGRPLDNGIVTTDTRPLKPETWDDPRHAIRVLTDQPGARRARGDGGAPGELPDVTPFIERRRDLPAGVVRTVVPEDGGDSTGARPRIVDGRVPRNTDADPRNGGGGGIRVIPTEPSSERRGAVPVERPRVGRPQPGERGGAPRPEATQPRARTPEERGDSPRIRRPEPGQPGGAPRPEAGSPDRNERGDRGDRGSEVRQRRPSEGSGDDSPRIRRPEVQAPPSYRDRDRDQGRDREPSRGGYSRPESRPDPPRSYDPPPARERERDREHYAPPPSRPAPEASPSRPQERERDRSAEPRRGEGSRGNEGARSAPDRPSRQEGGRPQARERRPPEAGDGGR
jgi:hypothetical protein